MTLKNTDIYDITISNHQTIDDDTDVIEEKNTGSYCIKNGKAYIIYKSADNGSEISSTVIVSDDGIKIKRRGAVNADMIYKKNVKTSFMYRIPYGAMEMEIETLRIVNALGENGGDLRIIYTLAVQGEKYYNNMKITVVKR